MPPRSIPPRSIPPRYTVPQKRTKGPRRFNAVTFFLLLLWGALVYGTVKAIPIVRLHWQAKEVVNQAVYKFYHFAHHRGSGRTYEQIALRQQVFLELRALGITDPDLEVVLKQTPTTVEVHADYTVEIEHPLIHRTTRIPLHPFASTSTKGAD